MKKYKMFATVMVLAIVLISPFSVSAKTKAGTKPGSFFYFFDKAFEKADLFFTFNPEKKAKKVLENAEERLAEAEESASEDNQEAVKDAMESYQKNIEVLEKVLEKVPEQAKEAITKVIEADKERQEEMTKKIVETKQEMEEKMNEIKKEEIKFSNDEKSKSNDDIGDEESGKGKTENESEDENKKDEQKEIEKLKKEVEALKQKTSQIKVVEKDENSVAVENKQSSSSQTKQKENIVTLPNGAVVEMDANGNAVRTIKEVPQSTYIVPVPTTQNQTQQTSDANTTSSSTNTPIPKINLSMNSNSTKAIPSTSNQIIAKFTIYSQDDKVNSNKSVLKLSISNGTGKIDDLSNFLLVDKNGTIVAGPVNPNNESFLTFTDTVTFPKGTMEYTLRGTVGSNFSNEQWIYVSTNIDNWTLKFSEESKPHIQPFQASEMGVFVSSQTNQMDNNGNYMVNINLTSLTDLTSLLVKLVNKENGIEYQQTQSRNVNNYSVVFINIPSGNYNLKMIADATTLIGIVETFTSGILVQ